MFVIAITIGVCCVAVSTPGKKLSINFTMFSGSKTDQILSRYRPIAPKPAAKIEGNDQTDTYSISSLSEDNSTTKSSTDYRSGKRSRKRPSDSSKSSPVTGKRARGGKSVGSMGGGGDGNFKLTPIFSDRVAPRFGPGGLQRFRNSFEQSPRNGVSVSLSLSAKSSPVESSYEHGVGVLGNVHSTLRCSRDGLSLNSSASDEAAGLERDKGFMERAAANIPSLYSTEHSYAGLKHESFLGYPSASTSFGGESEACSGFMERAAANAPSLFLREQFNTCVKRDSFFGCPSGSTSFGTESEVCSVEDAADSRKENIVTLSLLPDTPSFENTRSASSHSTFSLLRSDVRWGSAIATSDLNTSLTMSVRGRCSDEEASLGGQNAPESFAATAARPSLERVSEASEADVGDQCVDAHYLELRHGGSSEAVMLTDELDRVLWVNSAFKRLNNERMSSRMQVCATNCLEFMSLVDNASSCLSECWKWRQSLFDLS